MIKVDASSRNLDAEELAIYKLNRLIPEAIATASIDPATANSTMENPSERINCDLQARHPLWIARCR